MPTHFTPAALRFLAGLARNNDRTWFNDRKPIYETALQQPWLSLIDEINEALQSFAPDCVKPARKAAMRIYRDTRFSNNKLPYKTHVAAWWSPQWAPKTTAAGYYCHISARSVVVAAGVYMPLPEQLLAIRRLMQAEHAQARTLLHNKRTRTLLPTLDTNPLTRMPKGFPADDPAADLILPRQWAISADLPSALATTPQLLAEITKRFKAATPLVTLLNSTLQPGERRKTFF